MKLKDIYSKRGFPAFSFEFFPPKDDSDGMKVSKLLDALIVLTKYNPALVSITIGAGGYNQDLALSLIRRFIFEAHVNVMPHFTCICSTKEEVKSRLSLLKSLGVQNILALRGDKPQDIDFCYKDFRFASELVDFIKSNSEFSIAVAGYPEGHVESPNLKFDLDKLKAKVDSGAEAIYTQLFFDNDKFYKFVERAQRAGIAVPIIPGIMPVMSAKQLEKITSVMKVPLPTSLLSSLAKANDIYDVKKVGVDFAVKQCQNLIKNDVCGIHFYTMNRPDSVTEILELIK